MKIIDGKNLRDEVLSNINREVSMLPFVPVFCDVLVGDDPASVQYVKMKAATAVSAGIKFHNASFPASITTLDLVQEIKILNQLPHMCGIIIQLPLPPHIDRQAVLDAIQPNLDVDCLGSVQSEAFYGGRSILGFPAALACMTLLDSLNLNLANLKITVLGQGLLVGKPVTALLQSRGLKVNMLTRDTENSEATIKESDVIISGIGQGKYITGQMIKTGAVLIDAGTSESNGGIVGDIDSDSVKDVAGFLSPVPGGVGPVTVAMLLNNVLTVAKNLK